MPNQKKYFSDLTEEFTLWAYPISDILEELRECELSECVVYEAKRELGAECYSCLYYSTVGIRGNSIDYENCGKTCEGYAPRNGKSGCCKHRGYCYERGAKFILTAEGELFQFEVENE